jgi:hypothetical protein
MELSILGPGPLRHIPERETVADVVEKETRPGDEGNWEIAAACLSLSLLERSKLLPGVTQHAVQHVMQVVERGQPSLGHRHSPEEA